MTQVVGVRIEGVDETGHAFTSTQVHDGWRTEVDGLVLHTRVSWHVFPPKWQRGLLDYARQAWYQPPPGWHTTLVAFDHINQARETFQPRVDLVPA